MKDYSKCAMGRIWETKETRGVWLAKKLLQQIKTLEKLVEKRVTILGAKRSYIDPEEIFANKYDQEREDNEYWDEDTEYWEDIRPQHPDDRPGWIRGL
jgi:hypothetical protein